MKDPFLTIIISFTFGFILMFMIAVAMATPNEKWHSDAVAHHAAEYYLDSNFERQWRWLDEAKK